MRCDFLDNQLSAFCVRLQIIQQANWNAGDARAIHQHRLDDGFRQELVIEQVKEQTVCLSSLAWRTGATRSAQPASLGEVRTVGAAGISHDRLELDQRNYVEVGMEAAGQSTRVQFRSLLRSRQMVEPDRAALVRSRLEHVEVVADPEDVLRLNLFLCEEALDCRDFHAHKLKHVGPIQLYQRALQ